MALVPEGRGLMVEHRQQLEQKVDSSDLPTINTNQRDIKRHVLLAMNPAQLPSDDILPASSSKSTPSKPPLTAPPTGDQELKRPRLWGRHSQMLMNG